VISATMIGSAMHASVIPPRRSSDRDMVMYGSSTAVAYYEFIHASAATIFISLVIIRRSARFGDAHPRQADGRCPPMRRIVLRET
jgi:hypothetical protein